MNSAKKKHNIDIFDILWKLNDEHLHGVEPRVSASLRRDGKSQGTSYVNIMLKIMNVDSRLQIFSLIWNWSTLIMT